MRSIFSHRRKNPASVSSPGKIRHARLELEVLEGRIAPAGVPSPDMAIQQLQSALVSAFQQVPSLPIVGQVPDSATGTTIANNLTAGVQDAISNHQYQTASVSADIVHITLDAPVHTTATQQVPLSIPLGSTLTLTGNQPLNVYFDVYYDIAFDYSVSSGAVTMVDETSLQADEGTIENSSTPTLAVTDPNAHQHTVSAPPVPLVLVISATLPPGFSATGAINGAMPVKMSDHGGTSSTVGNTYFLGSYAIDTGAFAPTSQPALQASLTGQAHLDGDLTIQTSVSTPANPFPVSLAAEVVTDWQFNNVQAMPVAANPFGMFPDPTKAITLQDVQLDVQSLSNMIVKYITKIQAMANMSALGSLVSGLEANVPIINTSVYDLASTLGLLPGGLGDILDAVQAVQNLQVTSDVTLPILLGTFYISDPTKPAPTVTADPDNPPANAPQLIDTLNTIVAGLASVNPADPTDPVGMHFPILTDPSGVMTTLLGGQNTNLATFDFPLEEIDITPNMFADALLGFAGLSLTGSGLHFQLQLSAGIDVHGLYIDSAATQLSASGSLILNGGEGIRVSGGIYTDVDLTPVGTPEPNGPGVPFSGDANRLVIDANGQECVFNGHAHLSVNAGVNVGFSILGKDVTLFSLSIANKELINYVSGCDLLQTTNPITMFNVLDDHTLLLQKSLIDSGTVETLVGTFANKLLSNSDPNYYSGIEVQYPTATYIYVEAINGLATGGYYNTIATDAPSGGSVLVSDPFTLFTSIGLPDPDPGPDRVILVGGNMDYDSSANSGTQALLIGGAGGSVLTGGDLLFAEYVPPSFASQALAYVPSATGVSADDATANATIAAEVQDAVVADPTASGYPSFLIGTHSAILVGDADPTNFVAEGPGSYQEYAGSGGGTFNVSPTIDSQRVQYVIHGVAGAVNELLPYSGDDPSVNATSLLLSFHAAAGATDDTNSTKSDLAVDDANGNFVVANGITDITVQPQSATIPTTMSFADLGDTTLQNVVANGMQGADRATQGFGDTFQFAASSPGSSFAVQEPQLATPTVSAGQFIPNPGPPIVTVGVGYGSQSPAAPGFTVLGLEATDYVVLTGTGGGDSYTVNLAAGTNFTTDVQDSAPTLSTPSTLNVQGFASPTYTDGSGNTVETLLRLDNLIVTDNSIQATYHYPKVPNLNLNFNALAQWYDPGARPATNLAAFIAQYASPENVLPDMETPFLNAVNPVSVPVPYSAEVNFSSNVTNVNVTADGAFQEVDVNQTHNTALNTVVTMNPAPAAWDTFGSAIAFYTDQVAEGHSPASFARYIDPLTTFNLDANAGNVSFNDNVGLSTINVLSDLGTFVLGGASPADTINVEAVAASGSVQLQHNGVGLSNFDYVSYPETINVGDDGSLANVLVPVSYLSANNLVVVNVDDSQDAGPGKAWDVGQLGAAAPNGADGFTGIEFSVSLDPAYDTLAVFNLKVNAASTVTIDDVPYNFVPPSTGVADTWNISGADLNNTLAGPAGGVYYDFSNVWALTGADTGSLAVLNETSFARGTVHFSGFNNLSGAAAANYFYFNPGGTLSGTLAGGGTGSTDTLDYTAYTAASIPIPFHVDFADGITTGVAGGFSNYQVVLPDLLPVTNPGTEFTPATMAANVQIVASDSDADGPLTFSAIGLSAIGLGIDPSSGLISGTPPESAVNASPYPVVVTVRDTLGDSRVVSIQWFVTHSYTMFVTGGDGQSSPIYWAYSAPLQVSVVDETGKPASGQFVEFVAPLDAGPSVTFSGSQVVTGQGQGFFFFAVSDILGHATTTLPVANAFAGPVTIQAFLAGSSSTVDFHLTNLPGPGTILTGPATSIYGQDASFTASVPKQNPALGTPTGTIQFQVDGVNVGSPILLASSGTATFSTATLLAGRHTISALYTSNSGNFNNSTGTFDVTIAPALLTVTADNQSMAYGDSLPALTASISGFVNGDDDSVVTGSPSLAVNAAAASGVGAYSITVGQGNLSAANYTFAFAGGTLTISAANPTLSVTESGGMYSGLAYPATATVAGVVTGVDDSPAASLEGVTPTLTYSGITASGTPVSGVPIDAGTYTVVASFAGSADYNAASASATFIISAATPVVAVTDLGGTYDGQPYAAMATVAGVIVGVDDSAAASLRGVAPTLSYYVGSTATGTGTAVAPTHPGTYMVVASFAGTADGDYTTASASATFMIGAAMPTVFVTDAGGMPKKNTPYPATATVAGVVTGVDTTPAPSLEGVLPTLTYYAGSTPSGTGSAAAPSTAGTWTVVATYPGSPIGIGVGRNYGPASASATFVISNFTTLLPQIAVTDAGGTYNDKPFPAKAVFVSANGTTSKTLEGVGLQLTYYSGTTATGTPLSGAPTDAGTYTVLASFAGITPYSAASASITFVIAQASPDIRIHDAGGAYNCQPFPATATLDIVESGLQKQPTLTLSYYPGTTTSGLALGNVPVAAGTYTAVASYAGDKDYEAANASVTFTIAKAVPRLVVIDKGGTYSGKPFSAAATLTYRGMTLRAAGAPASLEGVPVAFTYYLLTATGMTPLSGAPIDAGHYEVDAFFPGGTDYTSASASTTFTIKKAKLSPSDLGPLTIVSGPGQIVLSGTISLDDLIPTGTVTITLGGVSMTAKIVPNALINPTSGAFTATFTGLSLKPGKQYTVKYSYAGDENFEPISADEMLTL